jgi:hypothetical protein
MNSIGKDTIVDISVLEDTMPVMVFSIDDQTELNNERENLDALIGDGGCPFCGVGYGRRRVVFDWHIVPASLSGCVIGSNVSNILLP